MNNSFTIRFLMIFILNKPVWSVRYSFSENVASCFIFTGTPGQGYLMQAGLPQGSIPQTGIHGTPHPGILMGGTTGRPHSITSELIKILLIFIQTCLQ